MEAESENIRTQAQQDNESKTILSKEALGSLEDAKSCKSDCANSAILKETKENSTDEDDSSMSGLEPIHTTDTKTILMFEPGDPENPVNWSHLKRASIVLLGVLTVVNSTLGSSIPTGDEPELAAHYGVTVQAQLVLPTSIFLIGYVLGPLIFAPLSESYGRKLLMLWPFAGFTVFVLVTCFAPDFGSFIFFRLMQGIFASSPISVTGGIYADMYNTHVHRGRAMALFMTATSCGPVVGPFASGFLGAYSWRWPYWFVLIVAGASWIPLAFLPETHAPTILKHRARKIRKQDPTQKVYAEIELGHTTARELIVKVLGRPFKMLFYEAIVFCSCLYLSLVYAIYYLFFQAYPLIFPPIYGFSLGQEGLTFIPIGIGACCACSIYLWWDRTLRLAKARNAAWADSEEYRRLPLACIGGPLFTIGMFWLGWSARKDVHWIVPTLSGIPTGTGFLLLFMSLVNYVVDAYEVFAASGLAATAVSRSLFGAVVPFAAVPLFDRLGVAWACSLLGFLSAAMILIPFLFIKYGDKLREKSKFCQELRVLKANREAAEERRRSRLESRRHGSVAQQQSQPQPGNDEKV